MSGEAGWGWLASGVSLVSITLGTLYQRRYCGKIDWRAGNLVQYIAVVIFFAAAAGMFETHVVHWTGEFVLAVAWLAVVLSIGSIGLLYWLIRRSAATSVASLFYLVPAVTAVMAYVLFGERLDAVAIVGMIACAAAVFLVNRRARGPERLSPQAKASGSGPEALRGKPSALRLLGLLFLLGGFLAGLLGGFLCRRFLGSLFGLLGLLRFLGLLAFFGAAFLARLSWRLFFFAFLTAGLAAAFGGSAGRSSCSVVSSGTGFSSSISSPRVYRSDNDSGIRRAVKEMTMSLNSRGASRRP